MKTIIWIASGSYKLGTWKKQFINSQTIIRIGTWGSTYVGGSVAYCLSSEVVIGGGGQCSADANLPSGYGTLLASMPVNTGDVLMLATNGSAVANGWYVDCNGTSLALAYVACLKNN